MIALHQFAAYVGEAFVLGSLIGAERQWRQRTAGLRTNALVALGAAAFVLLEGMAVPAAGNSLRIAAQVVSGIGFIGGGVIFREGLTITGLNTAATLWCSAAIGVLCGSGFAKEAAVGAGFVLLANVLLRPVAHKLERSDLRGLEVEAQYLVLIQCRSTDENHLRALLVRDLATPKLTLQSLSSEDVNSTGKSEIRATLIAAGRQDEELEGIVGRLSLEPGVSGVSWKLTAHAADTE